MSLFVVAVVAVAFAEGGTKVIGVDPAVEVLISEGGVARVVEISKKVAFKKLPGLRLPDINGEASVAGGKLRYQAYNIKIDSITTLEYEVKVEASDGLVVVVHDVDISLSGSWNYDFYEVIHISDHGSFEARAQGLTMNAVFSIGADSSGKFTTNVKQCMGSFKRIDLELYSRFSWIYELFKGKIISAANKPCDFMTQLVDGQIAVELNKISLQFDVLKNIVLDVRLLEAPSIANHSIELHQKGEFFYKGDTAGAPFKPIPLPTFQTPGRMIDIMASEHVLRTLSYVTRLHGMQEGNITREDLPTSHPDLLDTTCSKFLCIGFFIPQLSTLFPHSHVEINYSTLDYPNVQITKAWLSTGMNNTYHFRARLPEGSTADLFTLLVNMSLRSDLSLEKNSPTLHWRLHDFIMTHELVESKIGWIPDGAAAFVMEWLVKLIAIPKIDKDGRIGRKLPVPDNLILQNLGLQLRDGYISIGSDFDYVV